MVLDLVGYGLGLGSSDVKVRLPYVNLVDGASAISCQLVCSVQYYSSTKACGYHTLREICGDLAQSVSDLVVIQDQAPWAVIGGDAAAIGTWSGVAHACSGPMGLIWFDAHLDAHTETSHTQNIHGMPVASLMGDGPDALTGVMNAHPKLKPDIVTLERVIMNLKMDYIKAKVFGVSMDEIERFGVSKVLKELLQR